MLEGLEMDTLELQDLNHDPLRGKIYIVVDHSFSVTRPLSIRSSDIRNQLRRQD